MGITQHWEHLCLSLSIRCSYCIAYMLDGLHFITWHMVPPGAGRTSKGWAYLSRITRCTGPRLISRSTVVTASISRLQLLIAMSGNLTRRDLGRDLDALLSLPPSTLQSLTRASNASGSNNESSALTSQSSHATALSLLDAYSISKASPQDSQQLIGAYIRDMKTEILAMDRSEGDQLGARIDQVREKGEGVKGALSGVKI